MGTIERENYKLRQVTLTLDIAGNPGIPCCAHLQPGPVQIKHTVPFEEACVPFSPLVLKL